MNRTKGTDYAMPITDNFDKLCASMPRDVDLRPSELRCPRCHGKDIVPSLPRGIWDAIMSGMGRAPRHCRFCGKRFHPKPQEIERDAALRAGEDQSGAAIF